ncbi:hypothetical protein COB55_00525 [Candidatus Wolfebacteria bacterium]|nr:MAG: hypothetical protein COB55_00525 [Candidatus Wolfebacteria bacterium]
MVETKTESPKPFIQIIHTLLSPGNQKSLIKPTREIELGEMPLGTLTNEEAKRCYGLAEGLKKEVLDITIFIIRTFSTAKDTPKYFQAMNRWTLARKRESALRSIFWVAVFEQFPDAIDFRVQAAVRKNWEIVVYKKSSDLPTLISGLFGSS